MNIHYHVTGVLTEVCLGCLSWPGGCVLIALIRDIKESACSRQLHT